MPQRAIWGLQLVYFACSGHLNQLTRRIWPQRDTGQREKSSPATKLLEQVADTRLGFPQLGERTRASFRAGSFCSYSQGGDNLTHGGGAKQIQFGQSIREVMLCYVYSLDALLVPLQSTNPWDGASFIILKASSLRQPRYIQ